MRLYEFKNGDGSIDVVVTTDGLGDQKKVFVTDTPTGKGYQVSGSIPESSGAIQALGFYFTAGVAYDHRDFVVFAEKAGLQLLQWDEGLGTTMTEVVSLDGTYVYTLSVESPVNFVKAGETKALTIASTKQKVIDGVPQGSPETIPTNISSVTGVGFSASGTSIIATENTSSTERTGTAVVTQDISGKSVEVSLIQAGV